MVKIFDKQKTVGKGDVTTDTRRECKQCGMFSKTTTKYLNYWDRHCVNCGKPFGD